MVIPQCCGGEQLGAFLIVNCRPVSVDNVLGQIYTGCSYMCVRSMDVQPVKAPRLHKSTRFCCMYLRTCRFTQFDRCQMDCQNGNTACGL